MSLLRTHWQAGQQLAPSAAPCLTDCRAQEVADRLLPAYNTPTGGLPGRLCAGRAVTAVQDAAGGSCGSERTYLAAASLSFLSHTFSTRRHPAQHSQPADPGSQEPHLEPKVSGAAVPTRAGCRVRLLPCQAGELCLGLPQRHTAACRHMAACRNCPCRRVAKQAHTAAVNKFSSAGHPPWPSSAPTSWSFGG